MFVYITANKMHLICMKSCTTNQYEEAKIIIVRLRQFFGWMNNVITYYSVLLFLLKQGKYTFEVPSMYNLRRFHTTIPVFRTIQIILLNSNLFLYLFVERADTRVPLYHIPQLHHQYTVFHKYLPLIYYIPLCFHPKIQHSRSCATPSLILFSDILGTMFLKYMWKKKVKYLSSKLN